MLDLTNHTTIFRFIRICVQPIENIYTRQLP
jgi:hypothetical protein